MSSLNPCIPSDQMSINSDVKADSCNPVPTLNDVPFLEELNQRNEGIGRADNCDPQQSGRIAPDINRPNRNVIPKYSKALRGCDEAMRDLFSDVSVMDVHGKAFKVPIIMSIQERAVAAILQDNFRKDDSMVLDRIRLPMMSVYASNYTPAPDRYIYHKALNYLRNLRDDGSPGFTASEKYDRDTVYGMSRGIPIDIEYQLYVWTMYVEDMLQIVEQIMLKCTPCAYLRVQGVLTEIPVNLTSIANNFDIEPGDQQIGVKKFQFSFTAQTYIPQPIVRKKSVMKVSTNVLSTDSGSQVVEASSVQTESLEC